MIELAFVICLNGPRMFAYNIFFCLETHNSNSYPIMTTWIYEMAAMSQDEVECWLSVCRRGHVWLFLNVVLFIDCCVLACKNKDFCMFSSLSCGWEIMVLFYILL